MLAEVAQGEVDSAFDCVEAFIGQFHNAVARTVHIVGVVVGPASHLIVAGIIHEDVIAGAAQQGVVPPGSVQSVVAAVAGNGVGQAIARAVDVGVAEQFQVLQVLAEVAQGEADGTLVRVETLIGQFNDAVARIVHIVGVVVGPARHFVRSGTAVKDVIACQAGELVGAAETCEHIVGPISDYLVVERPAGGIFNSCSIGNGNIVKRAEC